MYLFFEQDIRGGMSYIKKRYAKANNKYMEDYDPTKESSYIMYLDANSLCSTSMLQKLPVSGFTWVDGSKVNLKKYGKKNLGATIEVDLEPPEEDIDYPLASRMVVTDDMLSPYQKRIKKKFDLTSHNIPKLIPNLLPQKNFVVHYKLLK